MKLAAIKHPRSRQEELGQFLTSSPVADFMASMFGALPTTVRLLDAGAGSRTVAFVSRLCDKHECVLAIKATLCELDPEILDALSATIQECQHHCTDAGIRFTVNIHCADFIQEMSACLARYLFSTHPPNFDAAIANPPYRDRSTLLPKLLSGALSVTELQN